MDQLDLGKMYSLSQFCAETVQGEGPHTGRLCTLLRFKKCNLCCDFCDTKYLMSRPSILLRFSELYEAVVKTKYLLITGGEPLGVYQNACATVELITQLQRVIDLQSIYFAIETNGIDCCISHLAALVKLRVPLAVSWGLKYRETGPLGVSKLIQDWDTFMCLLEVAGVFKSKLIKVIVKIVLSHSDRMDVFPETVAKLAVKDKIEVWAMPLGHTKELVLKNGEVALKIAKKYGFNFSSRLQIIHGFK